MKLKEAAQYSNLLLKESVGSGKVRKEERYKKQKSEVLKNLASLL